MLLLAACAGPLAGSTKAPSPPGSTAATTPTTLSVPPSTTPPGTTTPPGPPSARFVSRTFDCELLSGDTLEDPTANQVQTRFNLLGADLGIPVVSGPDLHLFFGDSVGYRAIWTWGEDPDSVASLPLAAVQADPTAVCRELAFYVTPDVPSVAATVDPAIQRDFAGAAMVAPAGESVTDYIADGAGPFPWMPGTFEVPTGGIELGGVPYLFYAGLVDFGPPTRATASYLVRWDDRTAPTYQIVRPVDALVDGALGGGFVQVAPVEHDGVLWLFGTGDYRHSGVSLARLDPAAIETGAGTTVVGPLFEDDGVGELSVSYVAEAALFVAMYQRELHDAGGAIVDNRVVVRVADQAEGPWSDAATIVDLADPAFQATACCGDTCPGDQILHCDRAGLYGAYLLPAVAVGADTDGAPLLDLPFVVSTWDPYDVVLFETTVRVDRSGARR